MSWIRSAPPVRLLSALVAPVAAAGLLAGLHAGLLTGWPVRRSYSERSTAAPRL